MMRLLVTIEQRLAQTPDGAVWTQVAYGYPFWTRYLSVFDHVRVLARVQQVTSVPATWLRADGAQVSFAPLPDYVGPMEYVRRARDIARAVQGAFEIGDAVLLRVPSALASALVPRLRRLHYPYSVQVVGDPYDVFAPKAVAHPLRIFWRWWYTRELKTQCANAAAAAYVTEEYLQRRYPCPDFSVSFSDVELDAEAFVVTPRDRRTGAGRFRLLTVGSLAQLYKAPDVLIEAVARCRDAGLDLELVVVGDGKYRSRLEQQARARRGDHIHFLGQLTAGAAVRAQMDAADVFVLPSRVEGLPRAMLEAMARGLPCIGSTVGGIPQLLPPEDMVPPGDADALARKIAQVLESPERMAAMSRRNLARSQSYRVELLAVRRNAFYRRVRESTQAWLAEFGSVAGSGAIRQLSVREP